MRELTDLVGEELAEFVGKKNIGFNPGYKLDPNNNTLHILAYTMTIISEEIKFQVMYHLGIRLGFIKLFDKVEIPENVNGSYKRLAETIGSLMKTHGNSYHTDLNCLPGVSKKNNKI